MTTIGAPIISYWIPANHQLQPSFMSSIQQLGRTKSPGIYIFHQLACTSATNKVASPALHRPTSALRALTPSSPYIKIGTNTKKSAKALALHAAELRHAAARGIDTDDAIGMVQVHGTDGAAAGLLR